MRAGRLVSAGVLTAAAFSFTAAGFAITGSLDQASASSPVSPPVSAPSQNPGQNGQNPGQSGKGQNGQGQSLNSEVSGPFSGTTTLDFGLPNPNCTGSFSYFQVFNATYTTSAGTGSLSISGCAELTGISDTNVSFNFVPGTFVLTAPDGATLQGTADGTENGTFTPFSVATSLTLTPTSGTNEFANAAGAVNLTGTWLAGPVSAETDSPLSGTLSGALT